jgi:hypothetical protein
MSRSHLLSPTILASLVLSVAACGGAAAENPPPADPPKAASTAPSAAPTAAPTAAPPAESTASSDGAKRKHVHDADGPDGVRRWALWDGPKTGKAITTENAWVVVPRLTDEGKKLSFGSVSVDLVDVVKADANEVVYTTRYDKDSKYAVPAALARPQAAPKGVKKGALVFVEHVGGLTLGRVEVAQDELVTAVHRFGGETMKSDFDLSSLFPLEGPLGLGSPVMARFDGSDEIYPGWIVATDADSAWVSMSTSFVGSEQGDREGRSVHKIKKANVTPIEVTKPLAVGAPCLGKRIVTLEPCKVKKVIEGGIAYVVTFEGAGKTEEETVEAGMVAPAPKGAKAK